MDLMKLEFGDLDQNGGDSESATKHAVVFLVEATGKLNRHAATIKSYIAPILSYFRNVNKSGDSEMASVGWPKDVRYGFVFFYSGDAYTGQETWFNFESSDNEEFALNQFDKIFTDHASFIASSQICVLEAMSSGVQYLHRMIAQHMPDQPVQKHFILVGQSSPFEEAMPTTSLRPRNFADAASILLEEHIHLSVIYTRKNRLIKELFANGQDQNSFIETVEGSEATASPHMILLNNISVRAAGGSGASKMSPEAALVTSRPVTAEGPTQGTFPAATPVTAEPALPVKMESGLPPGPAIQPMDIIPPTISAEDASKSTALFPVHTNPPTPGGSRVSKSPVVITDVSSPASIVFSPIGTDLMAAAQRKNAESPRPTVNLHHRASPMSGVAPTPIQQFYPSQPPSQPRFPVPVPQQVSIPRAMTNKPPSISVNQIAQDATALRPPRPPITDARNIPGIGAPRLSNSPMNYAQIAAVSGLKVANNERCIVWEGVLEWFIPGNNNTNAQQPQARTAHQLLSEVWVPVAEAVKAERWPSKLTIQFLPQQFTSVIKPFMDEPIKLSFNLKSVPGNDGPVRELAEHFVKRTATSSSIGCILIPNQFNASVVTGIIKGEPVSLDLRVIVFIFNQTAQTFQGFIPRDQVGFVDVLRQATQNTSAVNRQRQMVQQNQQQSQNPPGSGPNPAQMQNLQQQQSGQQNPQLQRPMQFGGVNQNVHTGATGVGGMDALQYGMMQQQQQPTNQPTGQNTMNYQLGGEGGQQPQQLTAEQSMRLQHAQQMRFLQLQQLQQQQRQGQTTTQQQQQLVNNNNQDPQLRQLLQNASSFKSHGGGSLQ